MESTIAILCYWKLGDNPQSLTPIKDGVHRVVMPDGTKYVLKRRVSLQNLEREYPLLSCLTVQGVPVAVPMATADGRRYAEHGDDRFCLYPFIEGDSLVEYRARGEHQRATLLGDAIGQLHRALNGFDTDGFSKVNLLENILGWAKPQIESATCLADKRRVLGTLDEWESRMTDLKDELPQHLIHRDPHPRNMLFQGDQLSGILDFDLTLESIRIFDPCYCATSMLADNWENEQAREGWLTSFKSIVETYHKRCPLSLAERRAIPEALSAIQYIFIAFCLGCGNFEMAQCNEEILFWLLEHREEITAEVDA